MVEARQACSGEPFFPLPENDRKGKSEKGFERASLVPIADNALFRLQILFGKKRFFFTHGVENDLFFQGETGRFSRFLIGPKRRLQPVLGISVNIKAFSLAHGKNGDVNDIVFNSINKPVSGTSQLDFITVFHTG